MKILAIVLYIFCICSAAAFGAEGELGKLVTVIQSSPGGEDGLTYSQRQLPDGRWVKTGVMVIFYPAGTVESVQTVVDDVLDGMRWDYSPEGKLLSRGNYKNGKPVGIWRIRRSDGSYVDKLVDPANEEKR